MPRKCELLVKFTMQSAVGFDLQFSPAFYITTPLKLQTLSTILFLVSKLQNCELKQKAHGGRFEFCFDLQFSPAFNETTSHTFSSLTTALRLVSKPKNCELKQNNTPIQPTNQSPTIQAV